MTYAEYCASEREALVEHEYIAGEVFAMTGGTVEHSRLAATSGRLLGNALEDGPCEVLTSDARVRIEAVDVDTYPDLSVVCGATEIADDNHAVLNPRLIVEVLSKSTAAYDRGLDASYFRRIPSLQSYLLVTQDRPLLELQIRQAEGEDRWVLVEAGLGQRLMIEPLGVELDVIVAYNGFGLLAELAALVDRLVPGVRVM